MLLLVVFTVKIIQPTRCTVTFTFQLRILVRCLHRVRAAWPHRYGEMIDDCSIGSTTLDGDDSRRRFPAIRDDRVSPFSRVAMTRDDDFQRFETIESHHPAEEFDWARRSSAVSVRAGVEYGEVFLAVFLVWREDGTRAVR